MPVLCVEEKVKSRNLIRSISLLCLAAIWAVPGLAQDRHLKQEEVPEAIKTYLLTYYPQAENQRFYTEQKRDTLYYEAAFRQGADSYTLFFLPDGRLNSVEKDIRFEEVPPGLQSAMMEALRSQFRKAKVQRVEIVNPGPTALYELEVKALSNHGRAYYEVLFDQNGKLIGQEEIQLRAIETLF